LKNDAFQNLPSEKRDLILNASLDEFALYGFEKASTNRIVRNTGISKGSLFQYFGSKKELYFAVLEHTARSLVEALKKKLTGLPSDIMERLKKILETVLDSYREKPLVALLLWSVMEKTDRESLVELVNRIHWQAQMDFIGLLYGADTSNLRYGIDETVEFIRWVLEGLRQETLKELSSGDTLESDLESFTKPFLEKSERAIKFLSKCVYK
jgi:AcrR family transcriptional regulator